MKKLNLTDEQKEILREALNDSYEAGSQCSTWLFNNMMELMVPKSESIEKILEKYCEKK